MSIAANRHNSIRAALCRDESDAEMCRKHNNANILVLGSHNLKHEEAKNILKIFLDTPFEGGRHKKRLEKI